MWDRSGFRRWLVPGVLGALLMLAGDWLLGYVDPALLTEQSSILRAGYAGDYALWRPAAAMATGTLGLLCYLPGLWGMALTIRNKGWRKRFCWTMAAGLPGWMLIHYFFSQLIYQFAWASQNGDTMALEAACAVNLAFRYPVGVWYVLMAVPFLLHLGLTVRGLTHLPRWTALLSPVVCLVALRVLAALLPQTPFAYGLSIGAMNEAMLIWFCAALLTGRAGRRAS